MATRRGSVSVSRVQLPLFPPAAGSTKRDSGSPGAVAPQAVSGCSSSDSGIYHYRTNCLVDRWDGVVQQSFRADFTFIDNNYDLWLLPAAAS